MNRKFIKGRSARLLCRRDEMLMVRFYYYTEVKRLRFDDVLKVLSEDEFFIETRTIVDLLTCLGDKSKERFSNKPSLAKLKEMSGKFIIDISPKEKERYEKNLVL